MIADCDSFPSFCFLHNAVKLREPFGPRDETDCSTRRCACRGVGQVRIFFIVTMVTAQSPRIQLLLSKCFFLQYLQFCV